MERTKFKVLLITPPFTQINTPYPATAQLAGFLKGLNYQVQQRDLGLDVFLKLFSKNGLRSAFAVAGKAKLKKEHPDRETRDFFLSAKDDYVGAIDSVIRFLQGKDDTVALRINSRQWLPEGPSFLPLHEHPETLEKFGALGVRDQAKYLASLFIDDLALFVCLEIDPLFGLAKYGEQLADSQSSFDPLYDQLTKGPSTLLTEFIRDEIKTYLREFSPDLIGLTCPFPGNVFGALKVAQNIKELLPTAKILMGGGYVNTELREQEDPRLFDFIDGLILDDGEKPMEQFIKSLGAKNVPLVRTIHRVNNQVVFSSEKMVEVAFKDHPGPDYSGLDLSRYVSMMELPNPMHRLWTDFRWNKMIIAHGCYWKKCTFCDVSLDYIQRFEPARIDRLIEQMQGVAQQTGINGFHFVDEAAPPAQLKALAAGLIEKNLTYTWWGNLRFDKQFTPEVTALMAQSGCIAVTGGLEVASPRLLNLINKGVTVEQVARVTRNFSDAGVFVHAYLMYGFPSQTAQETVDSLEVVRQLFREGCIQSAHWHRFVATRHSPVGQNPKKYGIELVEEPRPASGWFARNVVRFKDSVSTSHDQLGEGLRRALYNYIHGIGIESKWGEWFEDKIPIPTVPAQFIRRALKELN
jgi:radical SAM superfamily enzyme YgiQ (UPF0313 family)